MKRIIYFFLCDFKIEFFFLLLIGSFTSVQATFAQNNKDVNWSDIFSGKIKNFYEIQQNFKQTWEGKEIEKGTGYKVFKRWEAYMEPRVYPSGDVTLPSTTYAKFMDWLNANPVPDNKKKRAGLWTELGPIGSPSGPAPYSRTGAGRVNFVRFNPLNKDIMFVGAPDGGLWKSTNGGNSWTTNTDFLSIIGCSDLVISSFDTNLMYLATGDLESDRRSIGILKSIDGGVTWVPTSLTWTGADDRKISKLLMDPAAPLNMVISTNNGVYRTTDGWATFTNPLCCENLQDMEFRPGDPNAIYASGDKFWRSLNSGATWTNITAGLPPPAGVTRIALAVINGGNPDYIYALIANFPVSNFKGLYRSTNNGTTFTLQCVSPNILGYEADGLDAAGQGFYDLAMVSDGGSYLITGGINHWRTATEGASWTNTSFWASGEVHADVHDLVYLPGNDSVVFSCNDGGIFKSIDDGNSWADISNNLAIAQVVKIGLSATVASTIVAGEQDNGTNLKTGASWNNIFGGDGGECFIDYTDNSTIYIQYVQGDFNRSDDGGLSTVTITAGLPGGFDFYSTWHQDPLIPSKLFVGGIPTLYKSNNKGNSWSALGTPPGSGTITDFAVSPSNNSILYAIKNDVVSKSTDSGATFTNITGALPLTAAFSSITVSNTDPNKVWITYSGYSVGVKVYRSTNGGTTWTNVSAGLPNLPVNTIVYRNGSLDDEIYVGADVGAYVMNNSMPWFPFYTNLPNASVRDLEIFYPTGKLRAGTYGRGVWESDLYINTPLPATTVNFFGRKMNTINELTWDTEQEFKLDFFEVQRSADALNFQKIASISPKSANSSNNYQHDDIKPLNGVNYYRLKVIDKDANFSYSKIVQINNSKSSDAPLYYIYPNPANNEVTVELNSSVFSIQLSDVNGKVVYSKKGIKNRIAIDTKMLESGFYSLKIQTHDDNNYFVEPINILH